MAGLINLFIVGAGGFLGAIARYLLGGAAQRVSGGTFPLGTLAVNVLGCLLIGVLMYAIENRPLLDPRTRLFAVIGFLGAFTTFSAFGHETIALIRDGEWALALLNAGANLFLCLGAVILGRFAAKLAGI